jgi:DNA adenine methylase
MPQRFNRLLEPVSGMAAITVAAANERRAEKYFINDINEPIVRLLKTAVEEPSVLVERYASVWSKQFEYGEGHLEHYYHVRNEFNSGDKSPENMLYLLARCVKGSVRYGKNGNFNQSPDKRRHGTNPKNVGASARAISFLLKGRAAFSALDYREVFDMARQGDLVYMDPPYQGVSNVRDNRYFSGIEFGDFSSAIETLNSKGVDYLISYDGECGGKAYGNDLPVSLGCAKILLNAGVSTQATLLGKRDITFEALYVSENLTDLAHRIPAQATLF